MRVHIAALALLSSCGSKPTTNDEKEEHNQKIVVSIPSEIPIKNPSKMEPGAPDPYPTTLSIANFSELPPCNSVNARQLVLVLETKIFFVCNSVQWQQIGSFSAHVTSTYRVHARASFALPAGTFEMGLFYQADVMNSGDVHAKAFADIAERSESSSIHAKTSGGNGLAPVVVKPIPTPRRDYLRMTLKRGQSESDSVFSAVFIDFSTGAPVEIAPSSIMIESIEIEPYL
jgi:hypothetical protein